MADILQTLRIELVRFYQRHGRSPKRIVLYEHAARLMAEKLSEMQTEQIRTERDLASMTDDGCAFLGGKPFFFKGITVVAGLGVDDVLGIV